MTILIGIVLLLLIGGGGFFAKIKYEQSKMKPLNTQEVIPRVFAIKNNYVNFYLLKSEGKYIAIDSGENIEKTKKELTKLGISSDDVVLVLLTHSHSDHIGALDVFNKATIYAGDAIKDDKNKVKLANKTLKNNEIINIANTKIQCVSTPGHTADSVSYLINDKYLFVGDTLSLHENKIVLFNSFYNKSDSVQKESIEKLAKLNDIQGVFSGHYGFSDEVIFP